MGVAVAILDWKEQGEEGGDRHRINTEPRSPVDSGTGHPVGILCMEE